MALFDPIEPLLPGRLLESARLPPGRGRVTRVIAPGVVVDAYRRKEEAAVAEVAGLVVAINGKVTAWVDPGTAWPEGFSKGDCPARNLALAYRAFGLRAFRLIRGQWSAVIIDSLSGSVVLARDVPGLTPLFYRVIGDCLSVSSDLRLLSSIGARVLTVNAEALYRLVHFSPDPSDSFISGIKRCPPGHAITFRRVGNDWLAEGLRYWQPESLLDARLTGGPEEMAEELRRLVSIAVERTLPTERSCVALSGGLDSSTLLCFAATLARERGTPVPTAISLRFRHGGVADEGAFIRSVLEMVKTPGEDVWIDDPPNLQAVQAAAFQAQVPVIPTMAISRALLARARSLGVSTLLSGHGSDHILDGTPGAMEDLWRSGRRLAAIRFGANLWAAGTLGAARLVRLGGGTVLRSWPHLHRLWCRVRGSVASPGPSLGTAEADVLVARLAFEGNYPLADGHFFIDEEFGIEARYPFFDLDLIEFAFKVPIGTLMVGGIPRGLLRNCIEHYVPALVRERRSKGDTLNHSIPVWDSWCRLHGDTIRRLGALGVVSRTEASRLTLSGDIEHEMFRCNVAGVGAFLEAWEAPLEAHLFP